MLSLSRSRVEIESVWQLHSKQGLTNSLTDTRAAQQLHAGVLYTRRRQGETIMKFDECLILIETRSRVQISRVLEQMFFILFLGCVQAVLRERCFFPFHSYFSFPMIAQQFYHKDSCYLFLHSCLHCVSRKVEFNPLSSGLQNDSCVLINHTGEGHRLLLS